ncbi:MAG TPA: hypothetical protein VKB78_05320, partial [Pirellulales bacterium]|nr:hypothetical protein [Pirellulales bacterium]
MNAMFLSPAVRGFATKNAKSRTTFTTAVWLIGLAAISFAAGRAPAATYIWDSDGNDTNNAQDGSGTWSTTNLNWFLNNTTADVGWTNNTTDIAVFGIS